MVRRGERRARGGRRGRGRESEDIKSVEEGEGQSAWSCHWIDPYTGPVARTMDWPGWWEGGEADGAVVRAHRDRGRGRGRAGAWVGLSNLEVDGIVISHDYTETEQVIPSSTR